MDIVIKTKEYFKKISNFLSLYEEKIYLVSLVISVSGFILSNCNLTLQGYFHYSSFLIITIKIIKYLTFLIFSILLANIIINKRIDTKKTGIVLIVLLSSTLISRNIQLFYTALIILASVNIKVEKKMKWYLYAQSFLILLIVSLSSFGIGNHIFYSTDRVRYSLGFTWATYVPVNYFFIIANIAYLKKLLNNNFLIIYIGITSVLLFILTDTKFAFVVQLLLLVIIVFYLYDKNKFIQKQIIKCKTILICVPAILCIISIFVAVFYNRDNGLYVSLNNFLSNRLEYSMNAIQTYGFSFFGRNIRWVGHALGETTYLPHNYVDCSYLQIALNFGLIPLILIIIGYMHMIKKSILKNNYMLVIVLMFICVFSVTEPRLFSIDFNPFILLMANFFKKGEIK